MVTQRERLIAQGKRQVLLWLADQAVDRLKAICTRERCTQQDLVERLIMGYAADSGGDSIDRLAGSVSALGSEISQLADSVRDMAESTEDRLSDIEARLSAVEATINSTPVMPIPLQQPAPETPVQPAPGGNESAGKRNYGKVSNVEIKERRERFIALHHQGLSTTGISKAIQAEGFMVGTSAGEIDKYLRSKGLIPHSSRK